MQMQSLRTTFKVLRFVARHRFDTTFPSSMSLRVPEDETELNGLSNEPSGLTPEQDELRLHGLRILARIIARRLLADPGSFGDRSGTSRAFPTRRGSSTEPKESVE